MKPNSSKPRRQELCDEDRALLVSRGSEPSSRAGAAAGLVLALALGWAGALAAQPADPAQQGIDARRQAAIAEFTRKMKEANYPALFEKAAQEFNVPADVLKGIAFAETRWEHLTWPPGETASPDTGMPRPYGIMSLWDNPFFGHSLLDAAALIGQEPEALKADPLQNMRGAAALLRKLYEENPKPADASEADIESWRYAIRKYCGIPEPDLNARHALDVYVFMSQGYHQFGIDWNARPVNLDPIRAETAQIVAAEAAKRQAARGTNAALPAASTGQVRPLIDATPIPIRSNLWKLSTTGTVAAAPAQSPPVARSRTRTALLLLESAGLVALVGLALFWRRRD